ncbi:methanethiol oxidase [Adelges cooleyi]|uniref:methanethiol oxidase n=1 Tax=Adelges cooleyi TaxID=133065 RepID=UPI00217F23AB|nr:methanethiol oxidase [Adelges cooleyi]
MACCTKNGGPGYKSPMDAFINGKRETILYVVCIQPNSEIVNKPDYLATVDVNPESPTYSQVIYRTYVEKVGDELHHFGWNTCSSCHSDCLKKRNKIILPALGSDRIYILDVSDERAPKLHKTIEPKYVHDLNVSALHTSHCLPNGYVMISTMGDAEGNKKGDFLLIDAEEGVVKETWTKGKTAEFGYDFWYQPHWDVLVSSEWGTPKYFKTGFHAEHVNDPEKYGRSLNFYSWSERKLIQTIDLGTDGIAPLELRFLHNPLKCEGFVGCAVNSCVFRFYRKNDGSWGSDKVISVPNKTVQDLNGTREVSGTITDILISLDDKYLYFSNWLHGDIRQYDITDTQNPQLVGQIFLGGLILKGSELTVIKDTELKEQPLPVFIKDRRLYGSPQMLQLSLDGKRLYVTTALFTPWDKEFFPDSVKNGSTLVKVDVDTEKGGLTLDREFLVDFGKEPFGPVMAHETRYPGGDCTSDIWLADEL